MPRETATQIATKLPDEFYSRAEILGADKANWLARGAFIKEWAKLAPRGRKMLVYQQAADIWGVDLSTVREDVRNTADFGAWCDEMPFAVSRTQVRLARAEGRIRKVDPLVVLQERAEQVDKYGKYCPPRVWKQQLKDLSNGKRGDDGMDVVGRIQAACSAMATALKRAVGQAAFIAIMPDIIAAGSVLEDLLGKAELAGNGKDGLQN